MKKKYLLLILITLLLITSYLGVKSFKNRTKVLDEVKLKETNKVKKRQFAIMIENNEGEYEELESNIFPTDGYTFNSEKSGCIDNNGNLVENVLTYNETTQDITVETNNTTYCYVFFDIDQYSGIIGNFVTLDNQSGIYYRVLYNTSDTTYMLLRMNNDLGTMAFGSNNTYNGSTLDTYMNETYYNTLSSNIKSAIVDNTISQKGYEYKYDTTAKTMGDTTYTYQFEYNWGGSNNYRAANLTATTNVGSRKVYALDIEDIYLYMSALKGSTQRIISSSELNNMFFNKSTKPTSNQPVASFIHLRSKSSDSTDRMWHVENWLGRISGGGMNQEDAGIYVSDVLSIRPAFLIDLSQVDFTQVDPTTISCSTLGNSGC